MSSDSSLVLEVVAWAHLLIALGITDGTNVLYGLAPFGWDV